MITTEIEYIAWRKMWRVTVLRDGEWITEAFFHTEWGADTFAADARHRG